MSKKEANKEEKRFECQSGSSGGFSIEMRSAFDDPKEVYEGFIVGGKWKRLPVKIIETFTKRDRVGMVQCGPFQILIGDYLDIGNMHFNLMPYETALAMELQFHSSWGSMHSFETRVVRRQYSYEIKIIGEENGKAMGGIRCNKFEPEESDDTE